MTDGWCQMTISLGNDQKENVIIPVRTSAMAIIYKWIECENGCFEKEIVKT